MELLSGNEAIAQGAWEAGALIGAAYPGTPSTETMAAFGKKEGVYAEWSVNEKVSLEVALGASAAGVRSLVTMKHVGLNVAADPLFTAAYTGVRGGLVILVADDPGMHSSQNEQDSRFYALASRVPMFDPADSQEALQFTKDAFELSERFDVPFFIRSTTRISHGKTLVEIGERQEASVSEYSKNQPKWIMMPAFSKPRRDVQDARVAELKAWVEDCSYNQLIMKDTKIGVICAGAVYQYVLDALPEASVFKLGISFPLPENSLKDFADSVDELYVVEEASDYLSTQVKAFGISVTLTNSPLPLAGELTPGIIRAAFGDPLETPLETPRALPGRPPTLCAGCPHRIVFKELARMKAIVTGDIGCYTLAALPPLSAMDTCVDMGASVSMSHGFELAFAALDQKRPVVGVIGDSTFAHSGLSSLMNTSYNQGKGTIAILDNRTTAMTGRQGNPFNGEALQARSARELNLEALVAALGITDIQTIDPNNMKEVRAGLKRATNNDDLSVIIFRAPCVLIERKLSIPFMVTQDCTNCGVCISLGCPAISQDETYEMVRIDENQCVGCTQCEQYCAYSAIIPSAPSRKE